MKVPVFLTGLLSLSASAVTVSLSLSTDISAAEPGAPTLASADIEVYNVNDRTGLVPGSPVKVTVSNVQVPGSAVTFGVGFLFQLRYQSPYTVSAILGGETFSVSGTYEESHDFGAFAPPGQTYLGTLATPVPALEFIVPWDADLSALQLRLAQSASIDGAGNTVLVALAGINGTITTQSVPESRSLMGVAGGAVLLARRSRKGRNVS